MKNMKNVKLLSAFWLMGLLCANPAFAKSETNVNPYQNCQNLKKIKDIDDLLYQMHSNLDGDCLFKMPSKKLAKIWGIPIFDDANYRDDENTLARVKNYRASEQYRLTAQKPSLYIWKTMADGAETMSIHQNRAFVNLKKQQYTLPNAAYNGSLAQGKMPKYLPLPTVAVPRVKSHREEYFHKQGEPTPDTDYKNHFVYCWFNEQGTPENYLAMITSRFGVYQIYISNHITFFEQHCKQNPTYFNLRKRKLK